MRVEKKNSDSRQRWLKSPLSSRHYRTWLLEKDSLTARLQRRYADFQVEPVSIGYRKPAPGAAALLHMPARSHAQVREVLLYGSGKAVVFAHSVLPRKSLQGAWRSLGSLGSKPLGAVLFASPAVKRTPLTYKKLTANHALYQQAVRYVSDRPHYLWARRSIFSLNCASIMVVEIFLPDILRP